MKCNCKKTFINYKTHGHKSGCPNNKPKCSHIYHEMGSHCEICGESRLNIIIQKCKCNFRQALRFGFKRKELSHNKNCELYENK